MTLKNRFRAALTPSALLPSLSAITAGVLMMTLQTTSAQAAGQYYNCANATGCKMVDSKYFTSNHTDTKYPIVMTHGLVGFTKLLGVDYFYGIPQTLMSGGSKVYATKTSSFNDSRVRGEQLLQQVKTISAISGSPKVNLIGHSHGGHDIRYVAAVEPKYVASVTAVSSPEQGAALADWVVEQIDNDRVNGEYNTATKAALSLFGFLGNFMDLNAGIPIDKLQEQDGFGAVTALTTDYMVDFNREFPAAMPSSYCGQPKDTKVNGINYYSFSGVGQVTNVLDPIDYVLLATSQVFKNDPNDGLVSACSSRLGYVIRDDYKMNHMDSVNQLLGLVAWGQPNPKTVYRDQVNRLKNANL